MTTATPMSGRRAQAARNDELILHAARAVFTADPTAPIAEVAKHAGVGISALYRRYPSKEALLRKLCGDGLRTYIEVAEHALADDSDTWQAFADFMQDAVDADTSSLTRALAGTFTPTPEMFADAQRASELNEQLFERTKAAGVIRQDAEVTDMALIFEQLAAIKVGSEKRSHELRRRYLALVLEGLRAPGESDLPGPPPSSEELESRWVPAQSG